MILQWFAEMFYTIFTTLFGFIELPPLPAEVSAITDYLYMIITNGAGIVAFFFNPTILKISFVFVFLVLELEENYDIIMWLLKKIPMVGIN